MRDFSFSRPRPRKTFWQATGPRLPSGLLFVGVIVVGIVLLRPSTALLRLRSWIVGVDRPAFSQNTLTELQRQLAIITDHDQKLQDTLRIKESADVHHWSTITAEVTGTNSLPSAPLFILDRGARDGIGIGMPVVVDGSVIIGTVTQVGDTIASVLPLTHPSSRIAVTVENTQRTIGVVQGSANLALELLLVPRSETLELHQLIITSGVQPMIPRGLVVGEIGSIDDNPANVFIQASVNAIADPNRAGVVGVITNPHFTVP